MIKILIFTLIAFLSTILWNRLGFLVYLVTGYEGFLQITINQQLVLPWKIGGLLVIIFLTVIFFKIKKIGKENITRLTGFILLIFFYLSNCLVLFQITLYKKNFLIPFNIIYPLALLIFILIVLMIILDFQRIWFLLLIILLNYFYFLLINLKIPIDAYSDMYKVIDIACENFLSGKSPYIYRGIEFDYQCCPYLPGLWLSFLPFKILNLDLRIGNTLYMLLFLLFLYLIYHKNNENNIYITCLIAIFFLNPWLIFRHDIYYGIIFLLISLFAYFMKINKRNGAALCLGILLATHQIGLIVFFIWLAWENRVYGKKAFLNNFFYSLLTVFFIIIYFFWQNPGGFLASTYFSSLSHWQADYDTSHYNLAELVPEIFLIPYQAIIIFLGIFWSLNEKEKSEFGFFKILSIIIGLFLLGNTYNPHYLSFLYVVILLFCEIFYNRGFC